MNGVLRVAGCLRKPLLHYPMQGRRLARPAASFHCHPWGAGEPQPPRIRHGYEGLRES